MPLSRDEVLQGALRLLNKEGLEALTMRRLAQALGVQAGAIYWHFANKQELYDAMVDQLMAGLLTPPLAGRWDRQLGEISRRIAAALAGVRDGAVLVTQGLRPGPNALAASDKMLAIAREGGFSRDAAIWATSVLGYYVLGYVTDMQATEAARARGLQAVMRDYEKLLDRERYPQLAELGGAAIETLTTQREFHTRFEFGLEVILGGLRTALRAERRGRRAKSGARPRRRR